MNALTVSSPAKVNLYLEVLGRRHDGYHEIATLFHRISLCDRLILRKTKRPGFYLSSDHPKLKNKTQNLVYKAYRLLSQTVSWTGGVRVWLKKRVPVSAGMGGGSSNAAHFLLGMNQLFQLGLPIKTLVRIGVQLGADVPFFLSGVNQAWGFGKGEVIQPLPTRKRLWFVLVVPPFGLSTRSVYARLNAPRLTRISRSATITSAFFHRLKSSRFSVRLRNDLSLASFSLRPRLKQIDALFDELAVSKRLMSGSGPTFFSIHHSKKEARQLACKIRDRRPNLNVLVCHTY